jgi:O-acetyl-ADP-ribose deacetylase (regulator of RNase III)
VPTIFTKGDLFNTGGLRAYALGCHCAGNMDSGVALAFKKRWPRMADEYRARCEDGRFHLGDVFVWSEGDETVYCLAIQEHWKKKAKLAALSRSVLKMVELAAKGGNLRVGLPRIGTGLGGLDWPRVKSILTDVGAASEVELVVFEQFVRDRTA